MLADFGADVIKVERPGSGDDSRGWGPPFYEGPNGQRASAYFCATNRGKRSVVLDLSVKQDVESIRQLANQCDVLVENFKAGTLRRLGLDYESLSKTNPRVVYCSITGFGQTGPYASRPGYDTIVQGLGGLMSITGRPDGTPGEGPTKVGAPVIDVMTGVYAFGGIALALLEREKSGKGQHIDLALLDVGVTALSVIAANYLASGKVPTRHGNELASAVPSDALRCTDGYVMIMVGTNAQFCKLCDCIGRPDVARDGRFLTNESRVKARTEIMGILLPVFAAQSRKYWIDVLSAAGVPCGPINEFDDVFADPQIQARGAVVTFADTPVGDIRVLGNPLQFSRTPVHPTSPPTQLGSTAIDPVNPGSVWR